ncbi:MAG: hypothetical protein ACI38Z_04625 [Parafannyhessea sp.]|uniref:hypothetical protein n=1 Tax=Parafannyhessea sp. TaxID=2847324 RepID=UPI003EFEB990
MSRAKEKGTRFESAVVAYLRRELGDGRPHRAAPAGARDLGDVHGLWARGLPGIAECKNYSDWGRSDLSRWRAETLAERGNAGASWAALVVHRRGLSTDPAGPTFGLNPVEMTLHDLLALAGAEPGQGSGGVWVRIDMAGLAGLMRGDMDVRE